MSAIEDDETVDTVTEAALQEPTLYYDMNKESFQPQLVHYY